ncbi:MAG: sulfite exporter TauE/SafE family protein [Arcobacteraceae bacterium]
METEFLLLLALIIFVASLIHGSIGFGFPMVATPLIALITDIQTAIIYTLIPTLLVNIISIISEGNFLQAFKQFYPLALLAMLGSAIGTQILIYSSSDIFKLLLAVAILFYLSVDLVKYELTWVVKSPQLSRVVFGFGAGILSGLTNAMAPVLIIYTLESKFTKSQIIQASNICFLFGKTIQIVLFSVASVFTIEEMQYSFTLLIVVAIALYIGIKIKAYLNPIVYKKVIKAILFIISLLLIFQTSF